MRKYIIFRWIAVLGILGFLSNSNTYGQVCRHWPKRPPSPPPAKALNGIRFRVIISTDLGGENESDIQSLIYYLTYADLFDTEGLISSPPGKGRKQDILNVIDHYACDYPNLITWSDKYPHPDHLRFITKQGAIRKAPYPGFSTPTEGSNWIIRCAYRTDTRPLYVLVWGSLADVAQALHDDPSIQYKIRMYFIADGNRRQDPYAFEYVERYFPDVWMICSESTHYGWHRGGLQKEDYENRTFVRKHVDEHGALGEYFTRCKTNRIYMEEAPSVAYLLCGTPENPSLQSWGGSFVPVEGRLQWWIDNPDYRFKELGRTGAKTINKWRRYYLDNWQGRLDRCYRQNTYRPPMPRRIRR